jgi:hypothetical protein
MSTRFSFRRACLSGATFSVAVVAGAMLPALAQDNGEAIVRSWVEGENRFSFIDFDAGEISSDGGAVTISDFAMTIEFDMSEMEMPDEDAPEGISYRFMFPTATFERLRDEGGRFATDRFTADAMVVEFEAKGTDVPKTSVNYEGLTVANWSWAKVPDIAEDPAKPVSRYLPAVMAFYDHSFDSLIVDGGSGTMPAEDDVEVSYDYGKVVTGKTVAGNVSRMDMDGISFHATGEDGDVDVTAEIGPMVAVEYNIQEFLKAFLPGAEKTDEYETFIGRFEIDGIAVSGIGDGEEFAFSMGNFVIEDVGVRPPSMPVLGRADQLVAAAMADDGQEPDELEIVELVASMYGSMRLGTYELSGMSANVEGMDVFQLGAFGIHDLSSAGLGEFFLEAFSFEAPDDEGSGEIGEFSVAGVTFPPLSALMALEEAADNEDIAAILAALPTVDRVSAKNLAFDTPEGDFSIGTYLIESGGFIGPIPTTFNVLFEDFDMPVSEMEAEPRAQLQALGYDRLAGSFGISGEWSEETGTIDLDSEGSLVDGADFSISAAVGGIPRALFENPKEAGPATLFGATFSGASISLRDESLRDRVIGLIAKEQGAEPEMVKQMAMGMVPFALAQLNRPEFAATVSAAVKTFLEGDGNLTVEASPGTPLPVMQLVGEAQSDPGAIVDKLNLEIEAE